MSETILQEAERIINGQRRKDYGGVEESFVDIAARWTQELGAKLNQPLDPFDVVHLMIQLKLSRARNGYHRDSYVDVCGYAGLTEKLQETKQVPIEPEELLEPPNGTIVLDPPSEAGSGIDWLDLLDNMQPAAENVWAPFTYTDLDAEERPRVWESLDDVPHDVRVRSLGNAVWGWVEPGEIRDCASGWYYTPPAGAAVWNFAPHPLDDLEYEPSLFKTPPFTELLEVPA